MPQRTLQIWFHPERQRLPEVAQPNAAPHLVIQRLCYSHTLAMAHDGTPDSYLRRIGRCCHTQPRNVKRETFRSPTGCRQHRPYPCRSRFPAVCLRRVPTPQPTTPMTSQARQAHRAVRRFHWPPAALPAGDSAGTPQDTTACEGTHQGCDRQRPAGTRYVRVVDSSTYLPTAVHSSPCQGCRATPNRREGLGGGTARTCDSHQLPP